MLHSSVIIASLVIIRALCNIRAKTRGVPLKRSAQLQLK